MDMKFNQFPVLETDRLLLKQILLDDAKDLFIILSDDEVARYEYFYPLKSIEEVEKFIKRYDNEFNEEEEITWGMYLKDSNRLIGTCCIGDFEESSERCEIGYTVAKDMWNNGYATEALAEILNFGFNDVKLNRIEATITPGNDASVRVLDKLGFMKEGIVRERDLIKGKLEDGIIMSLLRREYL